MGEPIVEVEQGKLKGKNSVDYKGRKFCSFVGIPYAKPPVGELRFKIAQEPEPWQDVRDATTEASESLSKHLIFGTPIGSEDCLYLNVFTPQLSNEDKKLPVMVFIHGGGFTKGSSKTELHGPEYLVSADVILVTINYRLGILGFLSLEDPSLGVPGNNALKDMVQALKWVQKNIHNFGGDSQNVTIFGESAGSAACHLLMLSQMAKGLFHRVIMQSGSALNSWIYGSRNAKDIAKVLGFESDDEKELLNFLKGVPEKSFLDAQDKIPDAMGTDHVRPFGVVIEKPSSIEPNFITSEPVDIMLSGNYNKVPTMLGFTSREGMLSEIALKKQYGYIKMFTDFECKVPFFYNLPKGSELSLKIAQKIKEYYYEKEEPTLENLDNFYLLESDLLFVRGIYMSMKYLAKTMDCPVYLYRLSLETELNFYKKIGEIKLPGVCHADDLGYMFKTLISPELDPNSIEGKSVHRIIKLWTTFARNGNPNPTEADALIDVKWESYKGENNICLDIGATLDCRIAKDLDRMILWDEIGKMVTPNSKL